jgi:ubiquinone/menaquinone biosynthesis C-methylase UbiE
MTQEFDARATYDAGALDYQSAGSRYWRYLSTRTVERLGLRAGEHVLDAPCGTGWSLFPESEAVGSSGRVVGVDYAEHMLAIARDGVRERGLVNVELRAGDMTKIEPPPRPYDAVCCVLGIFFVDDMPGLVRSFRDLVQPGGGRVAVTVFGERFFDPMRDVFVEAVGEVAPGLEVIEPWRPTERAEVFEGVFADAGVDVTIETDDDTLPLADPGDWWRIVMGSGLRRTVTVLGDDAGEQVRARCDAYIADHGVTEVVSRSRYAIVRRS